MSRTTFFLRWHRILKSVMLIRGGGGPSQKVRAFCNSGWPDMRQSLPIDCLPILNKPLPILPRNERTTLRDVQIWTTTNPMHCCSFWHVQWAKEHPGKGPSGEPRVWPRDGHWRHSRSKQRFSDGASTLFAMLGGRWLKYVEIE